MVWTSDMRCSSVVESGGCRTALMLPAERRPGHPRNLGFALRPGGSIIVAMATERARARCRERLELLAASGGEIDALRREAVELLRPVLGFDRWCSLLYDPDTLVASRGIGENGWQAALKPLNLDSGHGDVNSSTMLARSRDP